MANKKISQLTEVGNVGAGDLFAVSVPAGGPYITKSCEPKTIATYALNPVPSDIPTIGFTGTQNVFFDKSNWIDTTAAAGDAGTHAYIMVNKGNGQLTTGSGIANPVGGDNMGDCKATTDLNLQNNVIVNANEIYFGAGGVDSDTLIEYYSSAGVTLKVKAEDDLILSGQRHVHISGQALDLASTPISGDVTFSQGGLTIPDGQGLTGDNIVGDDVVINKTSRHLPHNNAASLSVNWANSNIQHDTRNNSTVPNYSFSNALAGQTLTMYVENNHSATLVPAFTSGSTVKWGGPSGGPPHLVAARTNVYTFVCYDGVIFASAITGYVY